MATDTSNVRNKLAQTTVAASPAAATPQATTINDLINRQRAEIARALPKHMDADRLARIAMTVVKSTPKLGECTPASLLGALMLSAQTGLEPGPLGHAYFIPRWNGKLQANECNWQLGYRGIIELAMRSGKLQSIEAREVCEHDHFEYRYGLDEKLDHQPRMDGPRGELVAVWGLAKFKDGGHYFVVLSRDDIEDARARSDSGRTGKGPWATDYNAMARKTAIRRMAPFLPLQAEQAAVIAHDEAVTRVHDASDITADIALHVQPEVIDVHEVESAEEPPPGVDAETGEVLDTPTSAPADEPFVKMTVAQTKKLFAMLNERGVADAERHAWVSEALGRPVESFNEISKSEAGDLIDVMEGEVAA